MARKPAPPTKSETLSIRLDPKTRFVLEYLSRLKGQTITTVVERAIVAAAEQETLKDQVNGWDLNWKDFWDVSDGVRALNITRRREFFPTFEEERRLAFCEEHWPFFFHNDRKVAVRLSFMNILWPRIDEFIAIHEETKTGGGYWAAGEAMQDALRNAGLKPPSWPVPQPQKQDAKPQSAYQKKLDDGEIPF